MKKGYYVIAYDISNDARRTKLAKLLEQQGERVNFSVFECELDSDKLKALKKAVGKIINTRHDLVLYYPLCLNCRSRISSQGHPIERKAEERVFSV